MKLRIVEKWWSYEQSCEMIIDMIWPLSKTIFKKMRRRDLWLVSCTTIPQILRIYTERNGWYAPQEYNLWENSFSWCLISTHLKTTTPSITTLSSSWLDQPIWKICSSKLIIISPIFRVKNRKYVINHHLLHLWNWQFLWMICFVKSLNFTLEVSPWICSYVWGLLQENFYDLYFRLSCDI